MSLGARALAMLLAALTPSVASSTRARPWRRGSGPSSGGRRDLMQAIRRLPHPLVTLREAHAERNRQRWQRLHGRQPAPWLGGGVDPWLSVGLPSAKKRARDAERERCERAARACADPKIRERRVLRPYLHDLPASTRRAAQRERTLRSERARGA